MNIFVARQPIFMRDQRVYGYELLYRSGDGNHFQEPDGDKASLCVIRNALLVIGLDRVTGGKRAFINFTKSLLLNGAASLLPKRIAIVEILEDIAPDPEVLAACRKMRQQGYTLALDDFVLRKNECNPFTELVDIIKVDFMGTRPGDRKTIAEQYGHNAGIKLLAEKTETREDFQEAMDLGFSLFQGFFFSKPVLISKRDIPGYKITCLQVLKELNREELDFEALQKVIKRDPCLTYMLLKYLNSPFLGLRCQISSIKQALIILGDMEIKKWCSLSVLNQMGKDQPVELLRMALLRASFCESLALKVGLAGKKSELFLMGLFSFMDVILGRPLHEILEDVPIQRELKEALLGKSNAYRKIFDLVVAYERGQWPDVVLLTKDLKLQEEELPRVYAHSLDWLSKKPLAM